MTRTDRRRFPILIAAIAALALAMTLLFSPVQAQEGSAPDKPTGLSATATHDQVVLTWDDPGDASITGYVILRRVRVNNTGGEFSELVADTGTAATTYTDATVKANTTYTYRIKATNEHGVSERSRWLHINVPAAPEPEEEQAPEPPDQPTGLDATATHDSVTLTWDDPNDDSITGYVILRRIPGVDPEGQFSELVSNTGTDATTYTDDTVAAETRYTYRIKAINEHGVSERSRWFHINVPAAPEPEEEQAPEPPDQPTGLDATATHDSVTLTWDDPGDDTITGYVILRRVRVNNTGGEFSELVADTGTAATTYTDDSVQANTTYTYRIKATNEHGVSERSRWYHIDTPAAPEAGEGDDPDGEDDDGAPGGSGKRANVSEPDGGDLPVDNTTTGEVDVGGSVTGNIGFGLDGDWFKVVLEAGTRYQIDLEGADTSRGTLPDPRMGLYASNALVGSLSNDEGVGKNARRIYTPTAAGDYYVRAQNSNGSDTGTYTLSMIVLGANGASEADTDFPATTATTGRVDVGASATGNIGTDGDADWFRVDLEAGKTYQFDLEGPFNGRGTLEDPLLKLFESGVRIALNDDSGATFDSKIIHTPTAGGTYYLEAIEAGEGVSSVTTGTYTLSVREIPPCTLNTGDIWCGVVTVGEVKTTADALVGHGFADGAGLSAGSLAGNPDDTMFSVGDNDYTIMAAYIQVPTGTTVTGTLYVLLSADLTDDDKAGLVLTVDDTTLTFAFSGATKGTTGLYSWGLSGLTWSAGDTVTVRLPEPTTPDDFPADTTTTGQVDVGGSATGNVESVGDADWFKVVLEAGTRYQIDLEGADTNRGSLTDPLLNAMRDASSNTITGTWNDDSGVGNNARTIFTATVSGAHYVVAAAYQSTGTYTLSVIVLGANGASEADTDFSGTNISTVDVGASVTGTISTPTDTDWFDVALEVGKIYQFDLEGSHNGRGTLEDPYLKLYRFATVLEVNGDINSTNKNSQIVYTPTTTGTHSLEATTIGTATGTYTLSVRDISPCTLNTGDIWCGVVTVGELKTSADVLVSHGFADTSSLSAGGLVGNPGDTMFSVGDNDYTIRGLYVGAPGGNNDGSLFLLLTADLSDDDKENLVFKIDGVTIDRALSDAGSLSTGLYSWANTGLDWSSTTTVTVRLQGPPTSDDFPADATTTGQVDVGGSVTGNMDSVFDIDWFRVDLKKDKRYQIDLEGADTNRGTLTDPVLSRMRDALGNVVTDALDSGIGNNARRIFTAPADGSHYVVASSNGVTGTYTLSVIVLGANGVSEADTDLPATTATTGRVDVGASVTGNIGSFADRDYFRVVLEAGTRYQIDLEGAPTGRGTLADPALTLYDESEDNLLDDVNSGIGANSRGIFTPTTAGTYYLRVADFDETDTGTYTLSVRDITPPPDDSADPPADSGNVSEPDGEDLPEGITTTGRVEVGGSVTGEIAPALDVDWFAVELKKGKRYQFDVEGADTGRGNLADPHLWGLQDAGGQAVSGARSNDGGVGKNGRVINTPDAEGTYYIAVAGAANTTGTYTLSVIVLGANGASEADTDFPRDTTTTGRVEVGASATGNIDPGEDLDGFRVNLEAGKRYRFDLEGADTGRGSQADPILALYGDSFNVSHYIDEDDDGGEGLNSRLTYTATATGIYHLEVAGLDPGTYTLSVREILLAVAVPPGGLGPSEVPGAVRNVSVSYSPVSGIGGQIVWWDAPDETGTGAQWITEFRIYGSASEGCGGYLLDEYEVEHPGSTTPPEHPDGTPTGFKYFKIVYVGPVKFGVAAVNELGEGPCVEGPEPPPPPDSP